MTQKDERVCLGLPLSEALSRLAKLGIAPSVVMSNAPRRLPGDGELRVVRQSADFGELVVCGFEARATEDLP